MVRSSPERVHQEAQQNDVEEPLLTVSVDNSSRQRNYKGSIFWTVCPYILSAEFCERLAYYGVVCNLMVYLTEVVDVNSTQASQIVSKFNALVYLTPLVGAWLADTRLNRFNVIWLSGLVYLVGLFLMIIQAIDSIPWDRFDGVKTQRFVLYLALIIIGIGTGGIKPCVSAFGADQFDESIPQQLKEKQSFFNYFYVAVNIGSMLATTVVVYIQVKVGWAVGFIIPSIAMLMSLIFFISGKRHYTIAPVGEYSLTRVVKVVYVALRTMVTSGFDNRRNPRQRLRFSSASANPQPPVDNSSAPSVNTDPLNSPSPHPVIRRSRSYTDHYNWLDNAVAPAPQHLRAPADSTLAPASSEASSVHHRSTLDRAGRILGYTRRQVFEVKVMLRVLPVFFATIFYWTIYMQYQTFFIAQAQTMFRYVKLPYVGCFEIPAASVNLFDTVSIVVLLPIYDQFLLPLLHKRKKSISLLQRIGWGLVIAIGAMLTASGTESVRRAKWWHGAPGLVPDNVTSVHDGAVPGQASVRSMLGVGLGQIARQQSGLQGQIDWFGEEKSGGFGGVPSVNGDVGVSVDGDELSHPVVKAANISEQVISSVPDWYYECIAESLEYKVNNRTVEYWHKISPMHVLWLAPQYIVIGASEVMASVGGLEFFYDQSPERMRSTAMALSLLSTCFGSLAADQLVNVFNKLTDWVPSKSGDGRADIGQINYAHVDKYYLSLGVLMALNLLYFLYISLNYVYKKSDQEELGGGSVVQPPTQSVAVDEQESVPVSIPIDYGDAEPDLAQSLAVRPKSPAFLAPNMR